MAITLDPTLAAAQDSMERTPLVQMLATQTQESMPFDGSYFNKFDHKEFATALITLSDGSIFSAYLREETTFSDTLVLSYTDINKTFWTESAIEFLYIQPQGVSIVELSNGDIGIIFVQDDRVADSIAQNRLYYMIVTNKGAIVTAPTVIDTWANDEYPNDPSVILMENGTYIMSYCVDLPTGGTFELHTRISTNFTSWSSASVISLTPLLNTRDIRNTSLVQPENEDVILFFDYVDFEKDEGATVVRNIYNIQSVDDGSTWSTPEQITSYTEWGTSAENPSSSKRTDGTIALAYTDTKTVLFANEDTLLWENDCGSWENTNGTNIHFNPVTDRLYIYQIYTYAGTKALCGVVVMDTITWEVIGNYNTYSSPSFDQLFSDTHIWWQKDHGESNFICFSTYDNNRKALCVIDDAVESVTEYIFQDILTYSLECNVDISWPKDLGFEKYGKISATWVDSVSRRVYVLFTRSYIYKESFAIGYIGLDEIIDPATGKFPFHMITYGSHVFEEAQLIGIKGMLFIPEINAIVLPGVSAIANHDRYPGKLVIIDVNSGGILKEFSTATHDSFPWSGLENLVYYDGCLYGSFPYCTVNGQGSRRGMCKLNINTEIITYHEPTWKTADDYGLLQKVITGDGRVIVAVNGSPGGVGVFNITSGAWLFYSGESIQGFEPSGDDVSIFSVAYDPDNDQIMCGSIWNVGNSFVGVRMFNETGSFNRGQFLVGTKSETWGWSAPQLMTKDNSESDMAITIDSDNIIWSTWVRKDGFEYSIKWDRDIKEKPLSDFLIAGRPVTVTWSVNNTGVLSFSVSHGHLFDPNNLLSTWNNFLVKGKLIELAFGELISGTEYWQNQGIFIIDTIKLDYSRGLYPVMHVTCVSPDFIWSDVLVPATERYDTETPEDMATGLLMDIVGMEAENIIMPSFPNSHDIHHQWIDIDFRSIITEILDHFQCIPYFDMDGNFAPKIITTEGDVDHTYEGAEIIKFTPDDNYSSYTNRITVTGEGLYFLEVTYPEELIDVISGSGGWWDSEEKVIRVNYSNDLDLVCYDPRMVVITSIKDFKILWSRSGGDEWISLVDPLNRYLEVTIKFPGIMDVLIFMIVLMAAIGYAALSCTFNCGKYIFLFSLASSAASWILGQVASYEYEIYAKPTGKEKQLVSFVMNDTSFQDELGGLIVNEELTDPFCYTTQICNEVATHELSIVRAQRHRVHFEKITHLQDEICDRLQIRHPFSNNLIDIFVTDLERSYIRPKKGAPGVGAFTDKITGWRL